MKETTLTNMLMSERGIEVFDRMYTQSNSIDYILNRYNPDQGILLLALGAVGGSGAGKKVMELTNELRVRGVPFSVMAMNKYLTQNPLIDFSGSEVYEVDDQTNSWEELTRLCFETMASISQPISTVISFGPRTPNIESARRLGIPNILVVDGAVPDRWNMDVGASGYPTTPYYLPAYQACTFITTCGWAAGWYPPSEKVPPDTKVLVKSQPFSGEFVEQLRKLRSYKPIQARTKLTETGLYPEIVNNKLIVIPTMDRVYVNTEALVANGGWLTTEQFGQCYSTITELIVGLAQGKIPSLLYLPTSIRKIFAPVIDQFANGNVSVFSRDFIPNDQYLLLRRAGVAIGRAPLCVSTAEELGMGNPFVMAVTPGKTNDGISYMTEPEAFESFSAAGCAKCVIPGESIIKAVYEVATIKNLIVG